MSTTLRRQQEHGLPVTRLASPMLRVLVSSPIRTSVPVSVQADSQCVIANAYQSMAHIGGLPQVRRLGVDAVLGL
jgi:hypothetical protein